MQGICAKSARSLCRSVVWSRRRQVYKCINEDSLCIRTHRSAKRWPGGSFCQVVRAFSWWCPSLSFRTAWLPIVSIRLRFCRNSRQCLSGGIVAWRERWSVAMVAALESNLCTIGIDTLVQRCTIRPLEEHFHHVTLHALYFAREPILDRVTPNLHCITYLVRVGHCSRWWQLDFLLSRCLWWCGRWRLGFLLPLGGRRRARSPHVSACHQNAFC
mmetsp:Transcript_68568/g.127897  ORF Transcript_68568/g.127897 Transcript_68568/m.127897 type:complete len:215 (-) Transcript_68568:327-971(-)